MKQSRRRRRRSRRRRASGQVGAEQSLEQTVSGETRAPARQHVWLQGAVRQSVRPSVRRMAEGAALPGTREHKQRFHGWLPAHGDKDRALTGAQRDAHATRAPADSHADTDDVREHTHSAHLHRHTTHLDAPNWAHTCRRHALRHAGGYRSAHTRAHTQRAEARTRANTWRHRSSTHTAA